MKKKFFAVFISLLLCFSLVACGGNSGNEKVGNVVDNPPAENTSSTNNSQATQPPAEDEKELTIEEKIILDQDGIKVTATGINTESIWGTEVKLLVENDSEKNVTVQARNCVVNGYMVETMMSIDVAAGKKANDTLTIMDSSLATCGIEQVATIQFNLHCFDSDSWDTIYDSETIDIKTSVAEGYVQEYDDSGSVAYDSNGVKVVAKGIYEGEIFGPESVFYIENNTDKYITVQSRDVSVNGFMVEPTFSVDIVPGAKAVNGMTFFSSDLEENSIEQIEELEFYLHVFDCDSWDTIFDSDIITLSFTYE